MKKGIMTLLTLAMTAALTACSAGTTLAATDETSTEAETKVISAGSALETDSLTGPGAAAAAEAAAETGAETAAETYEESAAENGSGSTSDSPVLVAYFSATNTTEGIAQEIAGSLSADLYEIIPAEPYTAADLNYHDNSSRSTIEMNDPSSRPEISGSAENMDQYEIVFLGYPIWWAKAPRILSTFLESYDFAGKTIIPFCTSGGSGIGSSASELEELTEGATWLPGARFSGNAAHEEITEWVNGLGLAVTAE